MNYGTADIAERLRAARKAKGLSQRELSDLAGVPQAQISRIEAGTVDLRLSSLVALAHALDLELALVPRKAVPAVRSLSRDAISANRQDIVVAQKEMQRINEVMRNLQIRLPNLDGLLEMKRAFADIQRVQMPALDPEALKRLRLTMEQINRPTKQMTALTTSLKLLRTIRNKAIHGPISGAEEAASRPAYSLDEEDDDV